MAWVLLEGPILWLSSSRPADFSFGVPQGSVLGRSLFIVMSAPLPSLKLVLSPLCGLLMTHSYFTPVLLIRYTPLFWPCRGAFLTSRPGWRNTNWNWMTTRQMLSLWSSIEPFFLTLSPDLFVLALPTFRSRPALSTSVSLFQITLLTDTFQLSAVLLTWKSDTYVSSIRQYLTAETAKTLVCAFVLSK